MRIGVVGCGLIGARRARTAVAVGDEVGWVVDRVPERAAALAAEVGGTARADWQEAIETGEAEAVVVATPNAFLAPVAVAALDAGVPVLCEKPLGRNAAEAEALVAAAAASGVILKTGLNHRHKRAIARAHELVTAGVIGEPFAARAAYGHGGRQGYEKEWRGDPELAGGGELLDQGVHVIDLCRWFLGEFADVVGFAGTWFWDVAPLEDNAFALLRTQDGRVASLHTSWTQWRNLFRLEIFGRQGYAVVDGLGGSYGPERLIVGRRRPLGGVPDEETIDFKGEDVSWKAEWHEFRTAVAEGREPLGGGADGLAAARILDAIYASTRTGAVTVVESVL